MCSTDGEAVSVRRVAWLFMHSKIFIADNASSCVPLDLPAAIAALEAMAEQNNEPGLLAMLQRLVPEYQSPQTHSRERAVAYAELRSKSPALLRPPATTYGD